MCVFCNIISGVWSSKKVYEDEDVIAILDLSQQTIGHTLVIPKKHYENILELPEELLNKVMTIAKKLCLLYKDKLNCDGFNIVNNCNEVAGQTVMHFHLHIIPRYKDDNSKLLFVNNISDLAISEANNQDKYNLDEIQDTILK
ncbi:MAG: HIT family protein [Anaeroplasmataceae bacterium]